MKNTIQYRALRGLLLAVLTTSTVCSYPSEPLYLKDLGVSIRDGTTPILCQDGTLVIWGSGSLHFLSRADLSYQTNLFLGKANDDAMLGSPILGHDGVIYMGLNVYDIDNFFAVDPKTRTVLWRKNIQDAITHTPTRAPDGSLLVTAGNQLRSLM